MAGRNTEQKEKSIWRETMPDITMKGWIPACLALFAFIITLLPVYILAFFDRASGDDYGYGWRTHAAWKSSHSLIQVIKAAAETVRIYYVSWQGTFSSIFLFSLQPEVFSSKAYVLVPFLMSGLMILAVSFLLHLLLVKQGKMSRAWFLFFDSTLLFLLFQFVPGKKSSLFWYNGCAHYVIPMFLALMSIWAGICYIEEGSKLKFGLLTLLMALLGGTNYLAALLAPLILLWVAFSTCLSRRKRPEDRRKANRRLWFMVIPLSLEMIGLLISALAPGNAVRGGEDYDISVPNMLRAITDSFLDGFRGIGTYLTERPMIFLLLAVMGGMMWYAFRTDKRRAQGSGKDTGESEKETVYHAGIPLPGLLALYLFCTYCAMYWPEDLVKTEVSQGVPNTIFQVFVLAIFFSEFYLLKWLSGWIDERRAIQRRERGNKGKPTVGNLLPLAVTALILLIGVFPARHSLKDSTVYVCLDYILDGRAADYRWQMEQMTRLLSGEETEVVLPMINGDQGPLMHMPVMDTPDAWTSTVVAEFYGKDSVYAIPRREWEELYGEEFATLEME